MKIKGIRWWMVGLMTVGLIINYLARNTLSVAAPTLMTDLSISTEQYSHIVVAWQVCYALMQPIAGYVIDAIGTKMGFAIFAISWSVVCALAAFATGWQSLAVARGALGLTESAGFPGGVKAITEWFPAKERSVAIGWFNFGSSFGALLAPPLVVWAILHSGWQLAFLIVGGIGLVWSGLWLLLYKHPRDQRLLAQASVSTSRPARKPTSRKACRRKPAGSASSRAATFSPSPRRGCSRSRPGRRSMPGFRCT